MVGGASSESDTQCGWFKVLSHHSTRNLTRRLLWLPGGILCSVFGGYTLLPTVDTREVKAEAVHGCGPEKQPALR